MEADILLWIQNNIRNDVLIPDFQVYYDTRKCGRNLDCLFCGIADPEEDKARRRAGVSFSFLLGFD